RAYNANGMRSAFDSPVSTPTLLPAPSTMSATNVGASSVTWAWSTVAGAASYQLYNGSTLLTSTAATSWVWDGLLPNRNQTLTVYPVDYLGRLGESISASTHTWSNPPIDTQIIAAG